MNQNHIGNPEATLTQGKGPQMNDRDRLNDVLTMEKYLCSGTNIATWEASHQQLAQDLLTILNETHTCHRELYNLMFQMGWYTLEAAEQQKLDQANQKFNAYTNQFSYSGMMQ